jgi:hypothetical protein
VRHLEVRFLWLQEVVRKGRVTIRKIPGEKNPADILTKPKNASDMIMKLGPVNAELRSRVAGGEALSTATSIGSGRGGVLAIGHTKDRFPQLDINMKNDTAGVGSSETSIVTVCVCVRTCLI